MLQRWSLGLALSALLHAVTIAGAIAVAFVRGSGGPVDIEVVGMRLDEVKELPLGPPSGGARAGPTARASRPRARAPRAPDEAGTLASREQAAPSRSGSDDAAGDEEEAAHADNLRQLGPTGSRLTVLLRVDRLKATPYAAAVDTLLLRLPDRRDLLEGTGLDLYDAIDALLISTPNPRDPTVTFLAARHHLSDGALRAALDRGARATGRVMAWRTERGRPFAERRARTPSSSSPASSSLAPRRDERIIVMPSPGLVVVTPPIYRALLLAPPPRSAPPAAEGGPDGGAAVPPPPSPPSWKALLRGIDSEESVLPPEGIAMVSAVDIFKPASASAADTAVVMGMEVPRIVTAVLGASPDPFLEITAEFAAEAEARHWETEWPGLRRKLLVNPYVVLGGFTGLLGRIALEREGTLVHLRETATSDEALRLLQIAARFLGG
jgi:hypothetical protein